MKKVYKLVIVVLLLIGILFCINMYQFAKGVNEDIIKKKNQVNTRDSIKISDSTYLHLKEVK